MGEKKGGEVQENKQREKDREKEREIEREREGGEKSLSKQSLRVKKYKIQ